MMSRGLWLVLVILWLGHVCLLSLAATLHATDRYFRLVSANALLVGLPIFALLVSTPALALELASSSSKPEEEKEREMETGAKMARERVQYTALPTAV